MVSASRTAECQDILSSAKKWAESESSIVALGLIGSWARGNQNIESDVDLLVLTPRELTFTDTDAWVEAAVGQSIPVVRRAEWGALTERRLRLPSGLEVEFGFVEPSWASVEPIDPGTAQVARDGGLSPLYDPEGLLAALVEAML